MTPRKKPEDRLKVGRPSLYTKEIGDRICIELAQGKSLRSICDAPDLPCTEAVRNWLATNKYPEFSVQYALAREEQADFYADEIIEIADTAEDAQIARLRVDARKWKASKLAPKKYGDKVTNEHTGPDGGPIAIERIIVG